MNLTMISILNIKDLDIIIDIPNCKNDTKLTSLVLTQTKTVYYNQTMFTSLNIIDLKSYTLDIYLYIE